MSQTWWQDFFDDDYIQVWGGLFTAADSARETDTLIQLLRLPTGARVLDAPCGYGRLSKGLAKRGMQVIGVDFSPQQLEHAEAEREGLSLDQLRYVRADLRYKHDDLQPASFDAAVNMFSSLGYGSDDDDQAILDNFARVLKPGGLLFIETMHRDAVIMRIAEGKVPGKALPDGTVITESPRLDPIAGRIETTWRWTTPRGGSGQKSASIRIYTPTELVQKLELAGFELASAHVGCSTDPFGSHTLAQRIGLLLTRI